MNRLRFGVPKGSLQEATARLLRLAGWNVNSKGRSLLPDVDDPEIEAILLRAQEIPRYVSQGALDAGITGYDQILENDADVIDVCDLFYSKQSMGAVRLVLAVHADSSFQKVQDLAGKRIATELPNTVRRFLSEHGVEAEVEYSWGSTEAKVPDFADAVADLTETGAGLRAHNLRVIATVLESNSKLIANKDAWVEEWKCRKIRQMALLLEGALRAEQRVLLKLNVSRINLAKMLDLLPAMKEPTISNLTDSEWVAVETVVDEQSVRDLIPLLKEGGAQDIIELPLNKVVP